MDEAIAELIRLAERELGARRQGAVDAYQAATRLAPGPWPWSAAFGCWLLREWLAIETVRRHLAGPLPPTAGPLCREPHAHAWEPWARQQGRWRPAAGHQARRGDFAIFRMPHLGLVVQDQLHPAAPVHTIEADTLDEQGDDGIWRQQRAPHLLQGYLRFRR